MVWVGWGELVGRVRVVARGSRLKTGAKIESDEVPTRVKAEGAGVRHMANTRRGLHACCRALLNTPQLLFRSLSFTHFIYNQPD